jgi:hypothetical protein
MRLTYETGVATMIQFVVLALLNIINAIFSIIDTCVHGGGGTNSCVPNALTSVVFYILIVAWFGFIALIGYSAQTKRSKRISRALIAAELMVFVWAGYNIKLGIKYHNGALSLFTSLFDLVLAVWVISLAFRLMKAGNARVVSRHRVRQRPNETEL